MKSVDETQDKVTLRRMLTYCARQRHLALKILQVAVLAAAVFATSEIPYITAARNTPPGSHFIGYYFTVADINSYFSFIRQAANGDWIFRNNMTYLEHGPVFFQLQWLLIGKLMGLLNLRLDMTFAIWRALGIFILLAGFATLSTIAVSFRFHRITAIVLCAFGGGMAWVLVIAAQFGLADIERRLYLLNSAIDLGNPVHPFGQMAKNPHYALPHGTYLFLWYFYLLGERSGKAKWYVAAAVTAVFQGLFRQYDLLTLWLTIPIFSVLEPALGRQFRPKAAVFRTLPLIASAPVFIYYVYLFALHPVFASSSELGRQPHVPFHWHLLSLGVPGMLLLWRIVRYRSYPFRNSCDRLLLVWTVSMYLLYHANAVVPLLRFSPQVAMSLLSPIILLGVPVLPIPEFGPRWWKSPRALVVFGAVTCAVLTTPFFLARACTDAKGNLAAYVAQDDLLAAQWLSENAPPHSVVVSDYGTSSKLTTLTGLRYVVAHWAFSPHAPKLRKRCSRLVRGELGRRAARRMFDDFDANYLYVPAEESRVPTKYFEDIPGVELLVHYGETRIFGID